ncbi:hypothetical protein [Mycolicibacterium peregrinum]|uniref:Uncharacterized protein n=1 Tax=Mycolicibacterium peregrinum TaxID=43304 RepID=A0A4Z0HSY7_MYCPR|nr:hypothetical protein [Mycolicibacterium peregrinum]TGB44311.1 hypothetical protein EJD94_07095 [Mycolicibacterium peregrinum]TGB47278.1 hypothetical protein EJD98_05405 [Mycolicibacterium peregrinum]
MTTTTDSVNAFCEATRTNDIDRAMATLAGPLRVAVSEGRVAGVSITDALVLELDDNGQIRRLRPHLRPWLATTVFALLLGPKIARHPAVLRRALRR